MAEYADITKIGHLLPIKQPLKAIRKHCIYCMGGSQHEVELCPSEKTCFLWPYRFGKNPWHKKIYSKETLDRKREILRELHSRQHMQNDESGDALNGEVDP